MAVFMLALTTACGGDGNGNGGSSSSISGGTGGDGSGSGSNGGDGSGNGSNGGDGSGNGGTGGGDGSGNGGTGGDGSGSGGTGGGSGGDGSGNGGNGNGTTGEIGNQQELVDKLTQTPDGNFELTADIVITGNWKPIVDSNGGGFTGTLNGNDHTIKFENVTVTPEVINGVEHVGLVGINKGTIQNVIVEGTLEYNASGSGDVYVGAIAGTNENGGTIKNSKSKADIKLVIARPYNIIGAIGGIVGNHAEGIIEGVANLGNITLEHEGGPASPGCSGGDNNGFAGGVVGRLRNNGVLKNSYNTGNITNE
ncbi:MAG: hypothetical protein LBG61_01255, partial [Burkholderiales bacterium]|nr:hypothetical protein [Burkholderiales bacterium]